VAWVVAAKGIQRRGKEEEEEEEEEHKARMGTITNSKDGSSGLSIIKIKKTKTL